MMGPELILRNKKISSIILILSLYWGTSRTRAAPRRKISLPRFVGNMAKQNSIQVIENKGFSEMAGFAPQ
jgi:hypothetical protein